MCFELSDLAEAFASAQSEDDIFLAVAKVEMFVRERAFSPAQLLTVQNYLIRLIAERREQCIQQIS